MASYGGHAAAGDEQRGADGRGSGGAEVRTARARDAAYYETQSEQRGAEGGEDGPDLFVEEPHHRAGQARLGDDGLGVLARSPARDFATYALEAALGVGVARAKVQGFFERGGGATEVAGAGIVGASPRDVGGRAVVARVGMDESAVSQGLESVDGVVEGAALEARNRVAE